MKPAPPKQRSHNSRVSEARKRRLQKIWNSSASPAQAAARAGVQQRTMESYASSFREDGHDFKFFNFAGITCEKYLKRLQKILEKRVAKLRIVEGRLAARPNRHALPLVKEPCPLCALLRQLSHRRQRPVR